MVGAGPAVVGGGVVSGGWAEEDAAWARWWVARGDPVLGAWAVGAVALEKAWLGSPPSPGPGDASTCPAAPPPPVTFPAEVAEAAAAAAAAHNRARPPRLGRLLMARSASPFIHSVSRSVSHLLAALGPGKPPQPPPPPGAPSPPPSDRRPAPRAGPGAEGATGPSADGPPSLIGSLARPMGGHAVSRDRPASRPLCGPTSQSGSAEERGRY